jgi:hypothetical protein
MWSGLQRQSSSVGVCGAETSRDQQDFRLSLVKMCLSVQENSWPESEVFWGRLHQPPCFVALAGFGGLVLLAENRFD